MTIEADWPTNAERAERARPLLEQYHALDPDAAPDEAFRDLLTDLLHVADLLEGSNGFAALELALMNYANEREQRSR